MQTRERVIQLEAGPAPAPVEEPLPAVNSSDLERFADYSFAGLGAVRRANVERFMTLVRPHVNDFTIRAVFCMGANPALLYTVADRLYIAGRTADGDLIREVLHGSFGPYHSALLAYFREVPARTYPIATAAMVPERLLSFLRMTTEHYEYLLTHNNPDGLVTQQLLECMRYDFLSILGGEVVGVANDEHPARITARNRTDAYTSRTTDAETALRGRESGNRDSSSCGAPGGPAGTATDCVDDPGQLRPPADHPAIPSDYR